MSGVVRAEKFPELALQEEWLARGFGGEMKYLSDPRRGDPRQVMPGVRSVIVCALNYNSALPRTAEALAQAPGAAGPPPERSARMDIEVCVGRRLSRSDCGKLRELLERCARAV